MARRGGHHRNRTGLIARGVGYRSRPPNVPGLSCAGRAQRDPRLLQAGVGQPNAMTSPDRIGSSLDRGRGSRPGLPLDRRPVQRAGSQQLCQLTRRQQWASKTEPVVIHHGREERAHRTRPAQPRQTTGPRSPRLEGRRRLPLGQARRNATSRPCSRGTMDWESGHDRAGRRLDRLQPADRSQRERDRLATTSPEYLLESRSLQDLNNPRSLSSPVCPTYQA